MKLRRNTLHAKMEQIRDRSFPLSLIRPDLPGYPLSFLLKTPTNRLMDHIPGNRPGMAADALLSAGNIQTNVPVTHSVGFYHEDHLVAEPTP